MAKGRISQRTVEKLSPGETLWDDSVRGFGVRKQKSLPVYVLKYRFKRRQRFVTIGPHGSPWTPEEARSEARSITRTARADHDRLLGEVRRMRSLLRSALALVDDEVPEEKAA